MIVEDVGEGPRYNSHFFGVVPDPLHGEGFSGSGLPVGKDGSVEPFQYGVDLSVNV